MELDDFIEVRKLRNQRLGRELLDCGVKKEIEEPPEPQGKGAWAGLGVAAVVVAAFAVAGFIGAGGLHTLQNSYNFSQPTSTTSISKVKSSNSATQSTPPSTLNTNGMRVVP